ncbi:MAG: ribonuclease HI family protein [Candidatus Lernaella stagnicola]|nr:ribonuclease HI family protein [Candidatus Lernaella stagnicola]
MIDLKRTAKLLAALAEDANLSKAADKADLSTTQAKQALDDLAARLRRQAQELDRIAAAEDAQHQRALERTGDKPDALLFAFDGGSRGNPGPSAGAAVAIDPHGLVIAEKHIFLEKATNNVAEYQGLLMALALAKSLGVRNVRLQSDSELIVKQMRGEYKVKNKALVELFIRANHMVREFDSFSIHHVMREQNTEADACVNNVLDERAPKRKKGKNTAVVENEI